MRRLIVPLILLAVFCAPFAAVQHYRGRVAVLALARDSVEAAADTQRVTLTDSLRAVERRSVQVRVDRDAIDRQLRTVTVSRNELAARIRSLDTVAVGTPTVVADGVTTAHFDVYSEPYTVSATVELPVPPNSPRLRLAVAIDSVYLDVRQRCDVAEGDGVHRSRVTVTGPTWLPVAVRSSQSDPGACSPNAARIADGPRLGSVVLRAAETVAAWELLRFAARKLLAP